MSTVSDAWDYLTTAESWTGANGIFGTNFDGSLRFQRDSIIALTLEHLWMSFAAVTIAAAIALPLGLWLGHLGRGGGVATVISNVSRAMPTLALLTLFAASAIGFGNRAVIIAAAIFAFPPILTNAYTGMSGVDRDVREAAFGQGMTRWQVALRVELPLAVPLLAAGMRTSTTQTVATVPLAALVAGGGLGVIINTGLATQRYGQVLAGGLLVAALCLGIDALMARLERRATPAPLRNRATAAA
ncbi:ABC transporter permease [Demequina lignilytica]|uniref:ABC transporter permease n=1 Tax=Demequina lignilytica TaxID=3051663 RepID=A0AAW7MA81_9MICO|nr:MULTISPECIES: ABC transporter permease [unclassified Demequina]MDN4479292.1 ABC transporter permease [Demequina sp. SYSU T00039-1]MDN4483075.1 ABC transporter permease [Demequina sp. SYSU T0a273]MDN4488751.1 ABC transporter permease [Demequina sp. SYSU T00039]MDN4490919.1 ABC transporter permease [Demequina sp. SYSU T00068]